MKCDDCQNLLAEYIDGETTEAEAAGISAHLITCAGCTNELESLTAELEIFARYDRELEVTPAMWNAIEARTVTASPVVDSSSRFNLKAWWADLFAAPMRGFAFSGAMAVLIAALVIGVMYSRTHQQLQKATDGLIVSTPGTLPRPPIFNKPPAPINNDSDKTLVAQSGVPAKAAPGYVAMVRTSANAESDVLFSDVSDIEDKETSEHVQQSQNLLKSIRNLQASDDGDEIDVSYEKAESRRLLNENVVLRRDAEMAGKFPVKSLLSSLEPFLLEIANLPDKTTPNELRQIKERVQKTEIVAALQGY